MNLSAWTEAEKEIYAKLVEVTGFKDGQNAFRGTTPFVIDAWGFKTGGGANDPISDNACYGALRFPATLSGYFKSRDSAQAVAGNIYSWLESSQNGAEGSKIIKQFKPTGNPDVVQQDVQIDGKGGKGPMTVPVWVLTWTLEMLFNTSY
jgi:hypothetical protein